MVGTPVQRGIRGLPGSAGSPGSPGVNGQSATVAVGTVSGLPYGQNPTVTNSGSSSAAVFNFGIPVGMTGPQGPSGLLSAAGNGPLTLAYNTNTQSLTGSIDQTQFAINQNQVNGLTTALALLAPLASPAFTGNPTVATTAANTTGTVNGFTLNLTDNTTGTGGYSGLLVAVTGNGSGTGTRRPIDVTVAGTSYFNVDKTAYVNVNTPLGLSVTQRINVGQGIYANGITTNGGTTLALGQQSVASAADMIDMATGTFTHSSGTGVGINVKPTFSTTGTAGWTAFQVNTTQTNDTGTGTKLLANFAVGGTSVASIDTGGGYSTSSNNCRFGRVITNTVANAGSYTTFGLYGSISVGGLTYGALFSGNVNTSSNGNYAAFVITPTYITGGGSGYNTDLLINRTETAISAGTQRYVSFQTAGTEKLGLNNSGRWVYAAADSAPANTTTPAAWITTYVGSAAYKMPLYQ